MPKMRQLHVPKITSLSVQKIFGMLKKKNSVPQTYQNKPICQNLSNDGSVFMALSHTPHTEFEPDSAYLPPSHETRA